jgi:hypothetical protein
MVHTHENINTNCFWGNPDTTEKTLNELFLNMLKELKKNHIQKPKQTTPRNSNKNHVSPNKEYQ